MQLVPWRTHQTAAALGPSAADSALCEAQRTQSTFGHMFAAAYNAGEFHEVRGILGQGVGIAEALFGAIFAATAVANHQAYCSP